IAGFILRVLFWALLLGGLLWVALSLGRGRWARPAPPAPHPGMGRSVALDELDLRYARGEIARDEYLGRRADLMATLAPAAWAPPPTSHPSPPFPPAGGPVNPPGPPPAVPPASPGPPPPGAPAA